MNVYIYMYMSIWHIYIYTIRVRGRFELNEDAKSQGRFRISVRPAALLAKGVRDGPYGYVRSGCMANGTWIDREILPWQALSSPAPAHL